MKAIDLLRQANQLADQFTIALIEDMRDAPLTAPTPNGGNHPMWTIGHLAFTQGVFLQLLNGTPNPLEESASLFSFGSQPSSDPSVYPSFDSLLAQYRDLRAKSMAVLEELGDEGVSRPLDVPTEFADMIKTPADIFLVSALHIMNHRGQISDARRAAGRAPYFETAADAKA